MKKRYTVAQVRERLAQALDEAESGTPVFIERRGVTYRLSVEPGRRRTAGRPTPRFELLDEAIAGGNWTWDWSPAGLKVQPRRHS